MDCGPAAVFAPMAVVVAVVVAVPVPVAVPAPVFVPRLRCRSATCACVCGAPADLSRGDRHFHLDHCAAIPYFTERLVGFRGRMFATHSTVDVMKIMLSDFIRVTNMDGQDSLYSEDDLNRCLAKIEKVDFKQVWCCGKGRGGQGVMGPCCDWPPVRMYMCVSMCVPPPGLMVADAFCGGCEVQPVPRGARPGGCHGDAGDRGGARVVHRGLQSGGGPSPHGRRGAGGRTPGCAYRGVYLRRADSQGSGGAGGAVHRCGAGSNAMCVCVCVLCVCCVCVGGGGGWGWGGGG
jgi:hypothetical protein